MKTAQNKFIIKIYTTLITIILFSFTVQSQDVNISGRIQDSKTRNPIDFANVALLNPNDSSVVTGAISEDGGRFDFTAPQGNYILRVGFIGYQQHFKPLNIEGAGDVDLGNIRIAEDGRTLQEVTVEGVASIFESDIDKRVYNVENSIVAEGGTASELLGTLPSIQVDEEGGITMRGSGNILIYINGRPSNLSGDDTESILAQFPANSIKSVELITNPSSRYDAEGVGGIINIILKKDERTGLNGQVNASFGTRHKYTAGTTLNFKTEKFNFFANYNFQYRELFDLSEGFRENRRSIGSSYLDQSFNSHNEYLSQLLRTGFDYTINDRNTLGFYIQGNYGSRNRFRTYDQRFLNNQRQLDSLIIRDLNAEGIGYNIESGITYNLDIDTLGQKLYGSVSYSRDHRDQIELFDQRMFETEGIEIFQNRIIQNLERPRYSNLYLFQLDYEKPFLNKGKIEAGLKSTLSSDERIQNFDQFDQETNQFVKNELITDAFEFNEHVHAGYFIYRNKLGKFGYQAGLRAEQTYTKGIHENSGETILNDYFKLFPSLYLSYEVKEDEEFTLNYSRRIRRPRTWSMSPMINPQDLLNLRTGNPYLQPEFTDSYEAGYLKGWEKYLFTGTVYHRRASDILTRFMTVNENNVAVQSWANANRRISTGLEVINQFQFSDKVDATLSGNFFHSEIFGENIREDFRNSNFSWTLNLMSNIRIPNIASIQLQGNYRGPIVLPQGQIEPMYGLNIGIKRDLWDKAATISLNVSDVFNTRVFRIKNEDPFFIQERYFNRETRIGTITFTYRFKGFQERRGRQGDREDMEDDPF